MRGRRIISGRGRLFAVPPQAFQVNLVSHVAVLDRLRREIDHLQDLWKARYRPIKRRKAGWSGVLHS
jgi:sensor domain CHASE-containing protein